MITSQQLTYLL